MRKLFLTLFLAIFLLNFASAEVMLWNNVIIDRTENLTTYHAYYTFDDTSLRGFGLQKDIPITIQYNVESLPYSLTGGQVDWCNLTIKQYKNVYGTAFALGQGVTAELLNTTFEEQSVYFDSGAYDDYIQLNMKAKDSAIIDMKCHYTDADYLYEDNALIGRFTTYLSSYECEGCSQYTLEELSNEVEFADERTANELAIYDKMQTAVIWNYQIWLIISWTVKIGLVLVAVGLIFAGVYYFYKFFKQIGDELR
jgi:hypothetical protein